jgi:hypothetical protein
LQALRTSRQERRNARNGGFLDRVDLSFDRSDLLGVSGTPLAAVLNIFSSAIAVARKQKAQTAPANAMSVIVHLVRREQLCPRVSSGPMIRVPTSP